MDDIKVNDLVVCINKGKGPPEYNISPVKGKVYKIVGISDIREDWFVLDMSPEFPRCSFKKEHFIKFTKAAKILYV